MENICCDPSLEPSQREREGAETVLMMGDKIGFYGEMWLIIPKLSLLPLRIWSIELVSELEV